MKNFGQDIDLPNKPKLRINLRQGDFRTGPKDRRKVHTYVANDRRSGIADRRKSQNKSNS
jgi:hypothetical protein